MTRGLLFICFVFVLSQRICAQAWVEINQEKIPVKTFLFDEFKPNVFRFVRLESEQIEDGILSNVSEFENSDGKRFARTNLRMQDFQIATVFATILVKGDVSFYELNFRRSKYLILDKNGNSRLLLDIRNLGYGDKDNAGNEYPNYVNVIFEDLVSLSVDEKAGVPLTEKRIKELVILHNNRVEKLTYVKSDPKKEKVNMWGFRAGFAAGTSSTTGRDLIDINQFTGGYSSSASAWNLAVEYKIDRSDDFPVSERYVLSFTQAKVSQLKETAIFPTYRGVEGRFLLSPLDFNSSLLNVGIHLQKPFFEFFNAKVGLEYGISWNAYEQSVSEISRVLPQPKEIIVSNTVSLKNTSFVNYGMVFALEIVPKTKIPLTVDVFYHAQWSEIGQQINDLPKTSIYSRLNLIGVNVRYYVRGE